MTIIRESTVISPPEVYGDTKHALKINIVQPSERKKSKEEATNRCDSAGGEDNGYWRSGRFNYQIIEAGSVIYEGTFYIE